ncbi:MAG TPA: CHAD domain-containing protein [Solirubrobacteraceae bacterium]|nr:CHAD domain-containing protein [Solirubrobacteraceae bacterium]
MLLRAGEELRARRRTARGPRDGRLGLGEEERLGPGLERIAVEQADVVLGQMAAAEDGDVRHAVHEARKAIKRLRAIVRLLEGPLGTRAGEREQDALRAAAALLAGARDAEVLLETLEQVVQRGGRRLAGRPGVISLRLQLAAEREAAEQELLAPALRLRVADEMRLFRARAAAWQLGAGDGIEPIEAGLARVYRQGRRRLRRAGRKKGRRMRAMHQWRKRVKDLRYAAEILRRPSPEGSGSARAARRLARLAQRADSLGEVLGEEHDLAVLDEWIALHGASAGAGRGTRRRLHREIADRRRRLRRRALREGAELYERPPAAFMRRVGKAYRRSSPALSRR